jgi:hypothetical protein
LLALKKYAFYEPLISLFLELETQDFDAQFTTMFIANNCGKLVCVS